MECRLGIFLGVLLLLVASGCRLDDNRLRGNLLIPSIAPPTDAHPPGDDLDPVPLCATEITDNFGGGVGNEEDPYRICSIAQWNHFAATEESWDTHVRLKSDLDFTGLSYEEVGQVGDATTAFSGVFDGNGFTIQNLSIDSGAEDFALFLATDGDVTIKALGLKNISLTASTGTITTLILNHGSTGLLTVEDLEVENINFSKGGSGLIHWSEGPLLVQRVNVMEMTIPRGDYSGGIVGLLQQDGVFRNLALKDIVRLESGEMSIMGGIAGYFIPFDGTVPSNLEFSDISVENLTIIGSGNNNLGGLIAEIANGFADTTLEVKISNSHVKADLRGQMTGGLVGVMSKVNLTLTGSSFTGSLQTGVSSTGGLVAHVSGEELLVDRSHAIVDMTTWNGGAAGLISSVSVDTAVIRDSYVQGVVRSTHDTQGRVGGIFGSVASGKSLQLEQVYFAGQVTGNNQKGCIGGRAIGALVATATYFDSTTCTANAVDSGAYAGVTGQSTVAMMTAIPFTSWDPLVWLFQQDEYPELQP